MTVIWNQAAEINKNIDKAMIKKDLQSQAGNQLNFREKVIKERKYEHGSFDEICTTVFGCNIKSIVKFVKDEDSESDCEQEGR